MDIEREQIKNLKAGLGLTDAQWESFEELVQGIERRRSVADVIDFGKIKDFIEQNKQKMAQDPQHEERAARMKEFVEIMAEAQERLRIRIVVVPKVIPVAMSGEVFRLGADYRLEAIEDTPKPSPGPGFFMGPFQGRE